MWGRNKKKPFPMTLTRLEVLVRHNTDARTEAAEEVLALQKQVKELQDNLKDAESEAASLRRNLEALSDRTPIMPIKLLEPIDTEFEIVTDHICGRVNGGICNYCDGLGR